MIKRRPLLILFVCFTLYTLYSITYTRFDSDEQGLSIKQKEKFVLKLLNNVIEKLHFDPIVVNDTFSVKTHERFLKQIDPNKHFLYKSDVEKLNRYKYLIDDELGNIDLGIFESTYKLLTKRILEAKGIVDTILQQPFDFTVDEYYVSKSENRDYSQTREDMKDIWRKKLKYSTLSTYRGLVRRQEKIKDSIPADSIKSTIELEIEARETTQKSMKESFEILSELERSDWYESYISAFITGFDPHTGFIPAKDEDEFDMSLSGKLEGIGAVLERIDGITRVVRLISGGPAWKAGELEAKDKILEVRQEKDDAPTSIVGMKLDKAVDLIKGPKGTKVFLTLEKVDGTVKTIMIVRDVVELEEAYLKGVKTNYQGNTWGVIRLPKFYIDFDQLDARNSTSDMKKELQQMNKENVEGVIIDLRGNGGGSLKTAVEITGLFIEKGPVVQVKSSQETEILKDKDPNIYWDKPVVVLIDESSASASEIFAAAIQDYGRGIILGSNQSHGKGTVQTLIGLDRLVKNRNELFPEGIGSLKLTTQKFYRINGKSTQLAGVESDVAMLDRYSYIETGERDLDNPLPHDSVTPLSFKKWKQKSFKKAIKNSRRRVENSEQMKIMHKWAELIKERQDTISLSYEAYDQRIKLRRERYDQYDSLTKVSEVKTLFKPLASYQEKIEKDSVFKKRIDYWIEDLEEDIYVKEAINILKDLKD